MERIVDVLVNGAKRLEMRGPSVRWGGVWYTQD